MQQNMAVRDSASFNWRCWSVCFVELSREDAVDEFLCDEVRVGCVTSLVHWKHRSTSDVTVMMVVKLHGGTRHYGCSTLCNAWGFTFLLFENQLGNPQKNLEKRSDCSDISTDNTLATETSQSRRWWVRVLWSNKIGARKEWDLRWESEVLIMSSERVSITDWTLWASSALVLAFLNTSTKSNDNILLKQNETNTSASMEKK